MSSTPGGSSQQGEHQVSLLRPTSPRSMPFFRTAQSGESKTANPAPYLPKARGEAGRRRGNVSSQGSETEAAGMTPAPGGRREGPNAGLHCWNPVAEVSGLPPGPGCRKRDGVGRDLPPTGGWAQRGIRGRRHESGEGARAPATYQQALHVDGRARVSDQRLQLPLAAHARPVPRHGLGGAGHFPRRRGPAHAAAARPRTPAPRAPARAPRGLAPPPNRRLRAGLRHGPPPASSSGFGSQRRSGPGVVSGGRPARPGAAKSRRRPRPSVRFAPPGPLVRRELPQDFEGGSGEAARPPPGWAAPPSGAPRG